MDSNESLQIILDCFSGTDGGVQFVLLKSALERCEERGKPADLQVLDIVSNMARLIKSVEKHSNLGGTKNDSAWHEFKHGTKIHNIRN